MVGESSKIKSRDVRGSQENEVLFDLQREEEKEEEYDYFFSKESDENELNHGQYHVMDEQDLGNDDEEEMLDEEELRERNQNMLREL